MGSLLIPTRNAVYLSTVGCFFFLGKKKKDYNFKVYRNPSEKPRTITILTHGTMDTPVPYRIVSGN